MMRINNIKNYSRINIITTIIIYSLMSLYIILSMLPLLHSGYYSDDMVNSSIRGQILLENISFVHYWINFVIYMFKDQGRFIPVSIFTLVAVSYYFYNLFLYKALILVLIIINIYLFGYFIKIVFKEIYFAYILMLCAPICFQFRLYHDPILSFAGHLQFFFCYLMCSLIFLQKYLDHNDRLYLVISLILFNVSLYAYEISVPLALLIFILIFDHFKNLKLSLRRYLPFIYSIFISIIINLVVRFAVNKEYSGITFNFNLVLIVKTLFMQSFSSIPLSYYINNPAHLFNHNILYVFRNIKSTDMMSVVIFNVIYWSLMKKIDFNMINWHKILLLGVSLVVLPALPISLSAKYQQELNWYGGWGVGYLPVYIQYYGSLMILAGIVVLINKIIKANNKIILQLILTTGISLIILINLNCNRAVVDKANTDLYYGRETLEKALENNILKNIPENSTILVKYNYKYDPYPAFVFNGLRGWLKGYDWDNKFLFYLHSQKMVNIVQHISQFVDIKPEKQSDKIDLVNKNIFLLDIESYPEYCYNQNKEGYVMLGKINYIKVDDTNINKSKIYIKFMRIWHEPYAKEPIIIDKLHSLKRTVINGTLIWTAQ